jgi:hypothetical protein
MNIRTSILILSVVLINACKRDNIPIPYGAVPIIYCGYILVPVSFDSVKGNFLLDTGAQNVHFDSIFYSDNPFAYNYLKEIKIWGIGNSFQIATLIRDTIYFQLKDESYKTRNIVVHSLKPIGGDIIDGLVGLKFFSNKVLEINYPRQFINIFSTIDSVNTSGYSSIPIERQEGQIFIPLKITLNDKVSFNGKYLVDIGSSLSTITSSVAYNYKFDEVIERKVGYYTKYGGVGGYSAGFDFIADSLTISNFFLKNVNMSYSSDTAGLMASEDFYGIIGNNILERFDIIFDFNNDSLYLKPNKKFKEPYEFDKLGFTYVDRHKTKGGWVVTGLSNNSQAEKKGLLIDDIIISVNDIPVEKIQYSYFSDYFKKVDEVILVVNRAGNILEIEFDIAPMITFQQQ